MDERTVGYAFMPGFIAGCVLGARRDAEHLGFCTDAGQE